MAEKVFLLDGPQIADLRREPALKSTDRSIASPASDVGRVEALAFSRVVIASPGRGSE